MTSAHRPGTARGFRTRWILAILLATGFTAFVPTPPQASAQDPSIRVEITQVSPTILTEDATVALRGTITNVAPHSWTDVNAYLVIPTTPFRSRTQIEQLNAAPLETFGGRRIVDLENLATIGTLESGDTADFELRVPYEDLGIDGSEGVYPVGVHVLGTSPSGERDIDALDRAYTYVPKLDEIRPVDTSVVWPFTYPLHRDVAGEYPEVEEFIAAISDDGRLRRYLDLAADEATRETTVLVDPSLLVALREIAEDRVGPASAPRSAGYAEEDRIIAQTFLDDLLALIDRTSLWVLCYGRPDVAAFNDGSAASEAIIAAIRTATTEALSAFELTGRRATWPSGGLASEATLEASRAGGDMPVVLTPDSLPGWEPRLGSVLSVPTDAGPLPAIMHDPAYAGTRTASTASVRQLLLAQTAMAVLDQRTHADSQAGVVMVMDPQWDPHATAGSIAQALDAPWVRPRSVENRWTDEPPTFDGSIGAEAAPRSLSEDQMADVREATEMIDLQSSIVEPDDVAYHRRNVPEMVRTIWRTDVSGGEDFAAGVLAQVRAELSSVRIAGPRQVTLSGSGGRVPITVSNDLATPVTVGVRLRAQDTVVDLPEVEVLEIGAEQRTTLTLQVDLRDRVGATVIAEVTTIDGDPLGEATSFNVRTSQFGAYIWYVMAGAAVVFVVTLARRLVVRSRARERRG